jgi:AcrR family transcriptional regulator
MPRSAPTKPPARKVGKPTAVRKPASELSAPAARSSGYQKGDETRGRILDVAVKAFGSEGFKGATTRAIADRAGVNLPALKYYFGSKEGLYLACAQDIVQRYSKWMRPRSEPAFAGLAGPMDAADARAYLKQVFGALTEFMLGASGAQHWTLFVQRELDNPGPAFEVMYAKLWMPGIELVAALISRAMGAGTGTTSDEARVRAMLMIASLTAFQSGRNVALRALGAPLGPDQLRLVREVVDAQIDLLAVSRTG